MKTLARILLVFSTLCFAQPSLAEKGWAKLTRENCAMLLGSMRSHAITIDDIISETDALGSGRIEDCGPGCYEYADSSSDTIPIDQAANERMVAAAYADTLLAKGEGLFLLSRYKGFDVPAYDGLTFELATGVITARVSLKRGFSSYLLLDDAFIKSYRYSWQGGEWKFLAQRRAEKNPTKRFNYEANVAFNSERFDKIGRWLLVDDDRIKTRIVFQQPHLRIMKSDLPAYAERLLLSQTGSAVESVTLIDAGEVHTLTAR